MTVSPRGEERAGELPRQYQRACLLVLLAETPSHGYELLEQVHRMGLRSVDTGGLYRDLRAMEREALVDSSWEPSNRGPARRSYRLTSAGYEALAGAIHTLQQAHLSMGRLLDRCRLLEVLQVETTT
ncbi:MAG: PadR family transcriptional regulator [Acidimicrobiales bacterium]